MSGNMDSVEKDFFAQSLKRIEKHQEKTCDELKEYQKSTSKELGGLKDDVHKIDKTVGCLDERVTAYMDIDEKKTNRKLVKYGLVIGGLGSVIAIVTVLGVI